MDALLRLRVLIWVVVLSLWGVMVYQYLGEEEPEAPLMRPVVNPYPEADVSSPLPPPVESSASAPVADPTHNVLPPPEAAGPAPAARTPGQPAPVSEAAPPARSTARRRRTSRPEDRTGVADMPVPPGFVKSSTRHFNVYAEQYPASERFLELLETLHANLMLDLAPFSPWAREQKVSVFLFKSQEVYRRVTGRPSWSGGASSVPKRKVYVYESEELPGILAHELTHIYFDGFFLEGDADPLWLSEGMATLIQVERGLAAPNWLRENLARLDAGESFPIDGFVKVTSTSGWPDAKVRLWYAQAYSLVRYLIRVQYRSSFYKFAASLRDGRPVAEALYRAYGAPYTRLRTLEIAWRRGLPRASAERSSDDN